MRRTFRIALGLMELAAACALGVFAWQLPSSADVDRGFARAEGVTRRAGDQVRLLRGQVRDVRRPETRELACRLRDQSKALLTALKAQRLDADEVRAVSDALGDVANGLDSFADAFDATALGKVGEGLGAAAEFLDAKVAPAAATAAGRLDATTAALRDDAQRLADLLRQAPPDLKAAREVHDGLGRFAEGLDRVQRLLEGKRLDAMRDGFKGLETSLDTGAGQVERLAGYHYPVVSLKGAKLQVEERKFWPQGGEIAEGMRKAAAGAKAADEEMAAVAADLPKLRASLDEGRKAAERTRVALGQALAQQDKLEALLKSVPEHSARLAEELPKVSGDLGRVLRDTERLKDVGAALREARKGVDRAAARWPEVKTALVRSAALLKVTRRQLDAALEHRDAYEAALKETTVLAETFAEVAPLFAESVDRQLAEQERGLDDLAESLDDAGDALPDYARSANGLMTMGRLLAWLVCVLVGLHGVNALWGAPKNAHAV